MSRIPSIDVVLEEVDDMYDITFDAEGDITTADRLDTAILMSIHCERRASEEEVPQPERRRGWIGNESTPGFEIGSKVWLYRQSRITRTTLNGIRSEIYNGLKWMIGDNILVDIQPSDIEVKLAEDGSITASIPSFRSNSKVENAFYELWNNTLKG